MTSERMLTPPGPDREYHVALLKSIATVVAGLIVFGFGVGGLIYWLTSDWYHNPGPYPDGWAGFTPNSFWGVALFNMLTTTGYVLLYIGITTGARLSSASPTASAMSESFWIALMTGFGCVSVVIGILGAAEWGGHSFMNCLGIFCIGNKYKEVKKPHTIRVSAGEGWMGVVGMWAFFALVPIGLVLIYRAGRMVLRSRFGSPEESQVPAPTAVNDWARRRSRAKVLLAVAFVVSLIAILFFAYISFYIPNDWEYFTDQRFAAAARLQVIDPSLPEMEKYNICNEFYETITCPELPWAYFFSRQIKMSDQLYLKLFPSNVFFFCYLIGILVASFIVTHANHSWSAFWSRPMKTLPKSFPAWMRPRFTRGEFVGMWVTKWLFLVSLIYWVHDHNFDGNWNPTNPPGQVVGNTNSSRWARSTGQIALLALSLLLFAGSRESVMHKMLGTTWEAFIWAHKALGYVMLLFTVLHMAFWWKQYDNWKIFPAEIFQLPPQNPEGIDNFTIPLIFITTMVLFVAMGILALDPIRRKFFELFYYTHLFAAYTTIPVTLWHAAAGWEYMLPGLTVWFIDRVLRASRSAARVQILSARTTHFYDDDQSNRSLEPARSVELKFVVDSGALQKARPGQYVFVNVPEISIFEWHPFTLSHVPCPDATRTNEGNYLSLHIKSMGAGTWTDRLFELVMLNCGRDGEPKGITLAVDGPCGAAFDGAGYTDVILIGGGIGVTPVACIFDNLKRARVPRGFEGSADDALVNSGDRKLRAYWALREEPLLFTDLKRQFASLDVAAANRMHQDSDLAFPDQLGEVHLTRMCSPTTLETHCRKEGFSATETIPSLKCGRPVIHKILSHDLCDETEAAEHPEAAPLKIGRRPIVFVCGPEPLVNAAQEWCDERGVAFHRETFIL